ncbi:PREDICTED: sugar transporter ERD6-like 17 [Camelina sativa]|uniref:Sugar transporter ERD6-like 17 n=1 Tax=Camelina sativa TaxID=90675 RepID=A0ABM1REL5_CAMSA|nr:PREDICTED: sugar transporter ERD6-like 17 [Camelina sativa]
MAKEVESAYKAAQPNTDGASHENPGLATAGGVLRDRMGQWCRGFALNIGICSAPLAELWGVYYGLHIAWEQRVTRLELEVDSELTSALGMSITCMLLGFSFTLQKMQLLSELTPVLSFICVMLYIATYAIGLGGLPWVIMSEIFPINIKVTAGSIVTLVSFSSSSMVTYAFNFLFEWSTQCTFYIFGSIAGAALLFICLVVPETKGLSLEEIQAKLIHQPDEINQT